jgi:endonuclease/exonuclease/phosphatase family metal-dependent hydrolase
MRLLSSLLATLVLTGCAARGPSGAPSGATALRVLVYNIHAGKDAGGVDNLTRVADVVRQVGADVVLLQEVDRGTRRSGNVDQIGTLAQLTGFHSAFGRTLDYEGGEYGIALLSRWPIRNDTLIHLPIDPPQARAGGSYEPRGAQRVVITHPHGPLTVINTHLDASREDHYRMQESRTIRDLVSSARADGSALVIVGGDFNSTPESPVQTGMRTGELRDAWMECGRGNELTYPADTPVKRIDYLFLTGALHCTSAEVPTSTASDHRALLVTVTLPE